MNWKVNKRTLIIYAGIVWFLAGVNVFHTGVVTWLTHHKNVVLELALALLIFLIFFFLIFKPLVWKNIHRITEKDDQNHPLSFFNTKSWITLACMMTFGILGRRLNLFPVGFILYFYTGLATALMGAGVLYLYTGLCKTQIMNQNRDKQLKRE